MTVSRTELANKLAQTRQMAQSQHPNEINLQQTIENVHSFSEHARMRTKEYNDKQTEELFAVNSQLAANQQHKLNNMRADGTVIDAKLAGVLEAQDNTLLSKAENIIKTIAANAGKIAGELSGLVKIASYANEVCDTINTFIEIYQHYPKMSAKERLITMVGLVSILTGAAILIATVINPALGLTLTLIGGACILLGKKLAAWGLPQKKQKNLGDVVDRLDKIVDRLDRLEQNSNAMSMAAQTAVKEREPAQFLNDMEMGVEVGAAAAKPVVTARKKPVSQEISAEHQLTATENWPTIYRRFKKKLEEDKDWQIAASQVSQKSAPHHFIIKARNKQDNPANQIDVNYDGENKKIKFAIWSPDAEEATIIKMITEAQYSSNGSCTLNGTDVNLLVKAVNIIDKRKINGVKLAPEARKNLQQYAQKCGDSQLTNKLNKFN